MKNKAVCILESAEDIINALTGSPGSPGSPVMHEGITLVLTMHNGQSEPAKIIELEGGTPSFEISPDVSSYKVLEAAFKHLSAAAQVEIKT